MNSSIRIDAQQNKVGNETVATVYTTEFFGKTDLVVNALVSEYARERDRKKIRR